jgi:protein-S-isoprenylcysteine O-methyltransferase Ste14
VFPLARALVYGSLFVGFLLVFLPARVLAWSGVAAPERFGWLQLVGSGVTLTGALLSIDCVLTFVMVGKGTPAPFDPPRRLVVRGPYRWIRNPMYLGAGLALAGAAVYYRSLALAGYAVAFLLVAHLFVLWYEEPILSRSFGPEYQEYRRTVGRWWPRRSAATGSVAPVDKLSSTESDSPQRSPPPRSTP